MARLKILQDGQLSGTRKTNDGYLAASVLCARTGLQDYAGFELGRPDLKKITVYRPESSVFSRDSLATYAGKPATNDHPENPVTADNWKELAVGSIGSEIMRDGEYVRIPLVIMDASTIADIENGKREVSMGYEMTLDFTEGTTPDGESYDAVMNNLRMNHIAIVQRGRAGSKARIGDNWGASPLTESKVIMNKRTVTVDGLAVETTEQGAQAIGKLIADKKALTDQTNKLALDHAADIAEKDKELAAKDAEIKALKDAQLSDSDIDSLVEKRSSLIADAGRFLKDADFKGKTDLEIKSMVVDAVNGEGFTKEKSEAYIEAAFDIAKNTKIKTKDNFRDRLINSELNTEVKDNGYDDYVKNLETAHKGE